MGGAAAAHSRSALTLISQPESLCTLGLVCGGSSSAGPARAPQTRLCQSRNCEQEEGSLAHAGHPATSLPRADGLRKVRARLNRRPTTIAPNVDEWVACSFVLFPQGAVTSAETMQHQGRPVQMCGGSWKERRPPDGAGANSAACLPAGSSVHHALQRLRQLQERPRLHTAAGTGKAWSEGRDRHWVAGNQTEQQPTITLRCAAHPERVAARPAGHVRQPAVCRQLRQHRLPLLHGQLAHLIRLRRQRQVSVTHMNSSVR